MRLFSRFKKIDSKNTLGSVVKKEALTKSVLFVVGAMISALSYNLFFVPNNFVGGGLGGISIIINHFFSDIDPRFIILIGNLLFLLISVFTLGFKKSIMSIIGALTYTVFVYLTKDFPDLINFSFDNVLLYVLAAGVVGGFGEALVYKAGFNTGGTSIIALIIEHYKKMPLGNILRYVSTVIVIGGGIAFGYTSVMYSLIIIFISTYLVDKILIGISRSKMFFVHTDKQDEVKDFIIKIIESGVTELDSHGAFSHKRNKILMCVVPTEKYSILKSAIKEIDPDAFIVVSDCYEVLGGTKKAMISLED